MNYKYSSPYPKVQVQGKNLEYAKILLNDYAGNVSEDTAIHLYLYQHLVLKNKSSQISSILEHIAEVEMHHLELLGETITLLGAKPVYGTFRQNKIIYWNGDYVNYDTNLKNMLRIDIESETEAIRNYEQNIKQINDPYIQNMLRRIIEDEKVHLQIFESLYKKLKIST